MKHTNFLARLIGLYLLLFSLAIFVRRAALSEAIGTLLSTPVLILVFGIASTAVGLAVVLAHNVWHGGLAPVLITILGWTCLMRGLVLLFFGQTVMTALFDIWRVQAALGAGGVITVAIGAYLTWYGFAAKSQAPRTP